MGAVIFNGSVMMRRQILWATCVLWGLGAVTSVQAQDAANPFIGKWNVEWQGDKKSQEAELEITASGGTWKTATSKRKDPCVGLAASSISASITCIASAR